MKRLNLLYHRVNELRPDPWTSSVSPKHFEEHLEVIRCMFPRPVITFDDGYADNLYEALPLLERHDIEAQCFLVSGMLGSRQEMWWDALDRLFLDGEAEFDVEDTDLTPRQRSYMDAFQKLRPLCFVEQDRELDRLFDEVKLSRMARPERRMLTVEEAQRLSASPLIEIGAHTVSHPVLSTLDWREQKIEIEESKRALEEFIGREVRGFAFPNGTRADYSQRTAELVCLAGFAYAFSAFEHCDPDPFQAPRVMIRNWDGEEFARVLSHAQLAIHTR